MPQSSKVDYTADNPNYAMPSEDLFIFQHRNRKIPKEFCLKNKKQGGRQAVFQCLVCENTGPLKSIRPLHDHVVGKKHIRKACDAKRRLMGIPKVREQYPFYLTNHNHISAFCCDRKEEESGEKYSRMEVEHKVEPQDEA